MTESQERALWDFVRELARGANYVENCVQIDLEAWWKARALLDSETPAEGPYRCVHGLTMAEHCCKCTLGQGPPEKDEPEDSAPASKPALEPRGERSVEEILEEVANYAAYPSICQSKAAVPKSEVLRMGDDIQEALRLLRAEKTANEAGRKWRDVKIIEGEATVAALRARIEKANALMAKWHVGCLCGVCEELRRILEGKDE
jgi:hypothetical protein